MPGQSTTPQGALIETGTAKRIVAATRIVESRPWDRNRNRQVPRISQPSKWIMLGPPGTPSYSYTGSVEVYETAPGLFAVVPGGWTGTAWEVNHGKNIPAGTIVRAWLGGQDDGHYDFEFQPDINTYYCLQNTCPQDLINQDLIGIVGPRYELVCSPTEVWECWYATCQPCWACIRTTLFCLPVSGSVNVICCPNMPATLTATFSAGTGGCACMNGLQVTIQFQEAIGGGGAAGWIGTSISKPCISQTVQVQVACGADSKWTAQVQITGDPATNEFGVLTFHQCSPIDLEFLFSGAALKFCQPFGTSVKLTITV